MDTRRHRGQVRRCGPLIVAAAMPCLACTLVHAENWPTWRGPQGTGVSSEQRVPLEWDEERNVRWHVPLPDRGNSTPAVWGDRVFVTQAMQKENRRTVMCFDRRDGRLMWQAGVT